MIQTVWPYLAVMLLAAGLFPAVERRTGWKLFSVLPPIVLTYLLVTALAVSGLWQVNAEIHAAQSMLVSRLVPALLFLLMINCDLRAIWALGPRVLAVFACTSVSLFVAFIGGGGELQCAHPRACRATAQKRLESREGILRSLGMHFDRAVVEVAHPTTNTE